jgi:hypothetical protein
MTDPDTNDCVLRALELGTTANAAGIAEFTAPGSREPAVPAVGQTSKPTIAGPTASLRTRILNMVRTAGVRWEANGAELFFPTPG